MQRTAAWGLGLVACLTALWWGCAEYGRDVSLSPADWPEGEMERFTQLHNVFYQPHLEGHGKQGMIAGIQGALAVRSGLEALKQGGSAMDAALTTSLAQVTVQGGYGVTYAGFTTMVYYEAATGQIHTLNAAWNTVRGEDDPLSIPGLGTVSGRATPVPGQMRGFAAAHQRFGRLPFATLFEPAIYFAEQGFAMQSRLAGMINLRRDALSRWPESKEIFTDENGEFYTEGDLFRQPRLAETLKRMAAEGPDYMYRGEWAKKFVEVLAREGGKMTLADLENYEVMWTDPLHTTYGDYEVYTLAPPNFGGVSTLEMLNLVEEAGVTEHGHYTTSPDALYKLMRLSQVAGVVQPLSRGRVPPEILATHLPGVDLSLEGRVKQETAARLWKEIQSPNWAKLEQEATRALLRTAESQRAAQDFLKRIEEGLMKEKPTGSDCALAVDSEGNVAAVLHTINALTWGEGMFVDGVSVANTLAFDQELVNTVGPGVRLPDPTNPLIVLKDGKPVMASCVVGSWLAPATVQNMINVLDFGMSPKDAVDTPQFWQADATPEGVFNQQVPKGDFADDVLDAVRAKGQRLSIVPQNNHYGRRGYWVGIRIDPETGVIEGGVSQYFNGYVLGY